MPAALATTTNVERVEAPVTWKAYLMCAFASFGGIYFGYDSGYISACTGMPQFIHDFNGLPIPSESLPKDSPEWQNFVFDSADKSLIVSILSAGTFFGALAAGDVADWIGRRNTIIIGCIIYAIGVILQTAAQSVGLLAAGRAIAGVGVGFESAIVILYMSEIAPRKVRGALVSGYQFCITIGILLASCIGYATEGRRDTGAYRIPIAIQFLWALILGGGLCFLPESPRFFVKRGKVDQAITALAKLRGEPRESTYVQEELAEIIANHEYELKHIPQGGYFRSWYNCFTGSIWNQSSNLRRTILGTSLQMFQQWTGVNFIFYFGTPFFQQLGTQQNPFLISIVTTIVNVLATPFSFYFVEKYGRRPMLIFGALGMLICQYLVAILGTALPTSNADATQAQIAFICIAIAFFASTWGPAAWVVIGEVYSLPIRSRGVALSTASNWLWNTIIAVITPYMVDKAKGNLGPKVFFIWGTLCTCAFLYAYFLVPETKGLTLEQVDKMLEETTPRTSAGWKPTTTFAAQMGMTDAAVTEQIIADVERKGSVF